MYCILGSRAWRGGPASRFINGNLRGGRMPRQRMPHALLFIICGSWISGVLAPPAFPVQETPTVRTPPPQQIEPPAKKVPSQAENKTDRYTLSHDRYQKAVAYSRAGYTLYFLSFFIGFAVLI